MKQLIELIQQNSLRRGEFLLASGRKSDYLIDLKATALHPDGAAWIADAILDAIPQDMMVNALGGMAIGAVPLVAVTIARSRDRQHPMNGFYVREAPKGHGDRSMIYGLLQAGDQTILVEDVTTTGGSVLHAVQAVRDAGAFVSRVITVVDRLEGARENLAEHGITLSALLTKHDLLGQ